jgi:hypothetical protein
VQSWRTSVVERPDPNQSRGSPENPNLLSFNRERVDILIRGVSSHLEE